MIFLAPIRKLMFQDKQFTYNFERSRHLKGETRPMHLLNSDRMPYNVERRLK